MICLYPVSQDRIVSGCTYTFRRRCGYCETCRLNYRSVWAARILLESTCHASSVFVTLTYDELNYPVDGSVSKRALQLFFKRLRKVTGKIRYFACGEYGDRTNRAHYHCIIFGLECNSVTEAIILNAWNQGYVVVAPLNSNRSAYVAKYTTKKIRGCEPPVGCSPEFAIMSRRPGIGLFYINKIVDAMLRTSDSFVSGDPKDGDPVFALWRGFIRIDGKFYPAGRYLRDKVIAGISACGGNVRSDVRAALDLTMKWYEECLRGESPDRVRLRESHARKARRMLRVGGDL